MSSRVAVVLVESPWPPASGIRRRTAAVVEALVSVADVSVIVAAGEEARISDDCPDCVRASLQVIAGRPSPMRARWQGALAAGRGQPPYMGYFTSPAGRAALASALATARPDVVVTSGLGGAALLDGVVDPAMVVLDLADAEHERFVAMAALSRGRERLRRLLDARLVRTWLMGNLSRYRAVTVVSASDQASYARLAPQARLVVAPNGARAPRVSVDDRPGGAVTLVANFAYPPNRDGAEWFVEQVLPRCGRVEELRLVGRGSAGISATGSVRVTATGFVPDLDEEWARATISVAPVRFGGGTRIKVLEAFAAGVPVVATTLGAAGLDARAGHHFLAADTPEAFAAAVDSLLADPVRRGALADHARRLVEERWTWARTTAPLVAAAVGSLEDWR